MQILKTVYKYAISPLFLILYAILVIGFLINFIGFIVFKLQ